MVDMTEKEKSAIRAAGSMGGKYLDSIKKSDLSVLTGEEYDTFIECVVTEFYATLQGGADQ